MGLPYDMSIDMWSLGCILGLTARSSDLKYKIFIAELYTGLPIFPGENEHEQMACIMEIFSLPPDTVLDKASRKKVFFGEYILYNVHGPCNMVL